jgi:hypothetical protein
MMVIIEIIEMMDMIVMMVITGMIEMVHTEMTVSESRLLVYKLR